MISIITLWIVIILLKNRCNLRGRIINLRIGIILYFIYFGLIIFLKEKIVDYMYILGFLYGLEEGFYYSVYNVMESQYIQNKDRVKYVGLYNAFQNLFSIICPFFFGIFIYKFDFIGVCLFILLIISLQLFLSFILNDEKVSNANNICFKNFFDLIKNKKEFKYIFGNKICTGLTYSDGALSYVITIYIIKIFNESISLGIFTSIFSIISATIGILFAKVIKEKYYINLMTITSFITVILLCVMLFNCNFITVILYNLFKTISRELTDLINEKNTFYLSNMSEIKNKFKVEYFVCIETCLFIGRFISNFLFISIIFIDINLIMIIFVLFTIFESIYSIRLQKSMIKG